MFDCSQTAGKASSSSRICFTVVIATCDRPDRLEEALRAVDAAAAETGRKHDVIVVDNGGDRPARRSVEKFYPSSGCNVTYLASQPHDKAKALNAGIRASRTDWLAFTDDDALPDANWLKEGARFAETLGLKIFGGKLVAGRIDDTLPRWLKPGKSGRVPKGPAIVEYAPLPSSGIIGENSTVPFGANVFVKKEIFERHGGYDEALWSRCGIAALGCEDAEFAMRVRRAGEPVGYCAEAIVVHPVYAERATLGNHLRRAYYHGVREPIVPQNSSRAATMRYLLAHSAIAAFQAIFSAGRGDSAGAVCDLMRSAQCLGEVRGKGIRCSKGN